MANNGSATIVVTNATLPTTTNIIISTTSFPEYEEVFSGLAITCIYGGSYVLLMLLLALKIYLHKKKNGVEYSAWGYIEAIWKDRGIYGALLVHIYDTATDFGVLWEWYHLWQIEKEGRNIISLDMEQFFTTAIGFLIAYRILLGLAGWGGLTSFLYNEKDWNLCMALITGFFVGFLTGLMEFTVFAAILGDHYEKGVGRGDENGPGEIQKACQSSEGVLEALPEVIMQSVFYMRAYNDPYLRTRASGIYILVAISIFASLLSISSKYIWVDEYMVDDQSKSCFVKNRYNMDKFVSKISYRGYHISYGYIIRVIWRLSAVGARFVIFALIWVVLGGAFEIIYIPGMVIFWYLLLFFYVTRGQYEVVKNLAQEIWKGLFRYCCDSCMEFAENALKTTTTFFGVIIGGVALQLGIGGITGGVIYALRVLENFIIMTVITIFAFYQFDCWRCADSIQRQAWSPANDDGNKRIFVWVCNGWVAILIHLVTSLLMIKIMDEDYEFNVATYAQEKLEEAKKEKQARLRREQMRKREEREEQDL
eukprot:390835_1